MNSTQVDERIRHDTGSSVAADEGAEHTGRGWGSLRSSSGAPLPSSFDSPLLPGQDTSGTAGPTDEFAPGAEAAGSHGPIHQITARAGTRSRWICLGTDLTYLVTTFVMSLVGFVLLLPILLLGIATSVVWIGVPILGFTLLLASGFARENTELIARFTGLRSAPPRYRAAGTGPRRLVRMVADAQLWRELVHALLVALPLRLATFVVAVSWVVAGFGGLTFFAWSVFVPGNQGLGSLLLPIAFPGLVFDAYLVDSVVHGAVGAAMVLLAPFITRTLVSIDVSIARVLLPGDTLNGND